MMAGLRARLTLAIAGPLVSIGAAEAVLRATGFRFDPTPLEILIGREDPIRVKTRPDPDLFWTMRPLSRIEHPEGTIEINRLGTRGPLPPVEREPGTLRVICLGDSTAFGNLTSYPRELGRVLRGIAPDRRVEVINAGIPGYSSWQGLRLLERDLLEFRPDVVTFCFGFNNAKAMRDGLSDRERAGETGSFWLRVSRLASRLRVAQAIKKAIFARRKHDLTFHPSRTDLALRVSPSEHRLVAERCARLCASSGVRFIAMTQPHGFRIPEESFADDEDGAALAREQRRRLDAQNYALRAQAARAGFELLDLASIVARKDCRALFVNPWPGPDSIHPNPLLSRIIAELIATHIASEPEPGSPGSTPPALPAWTRGASPIDGRAADRDGDGVDELFVACQSETGPLAGWWDPRREEFSPVALGDLSPGDAVMALQTLSRPPEILLTTRISDGRMYVASLDARGAPGLVEGRVVPAPLDAGHLLIEPIDLDGDGRDEYLLGHGPGAPPRLTVLSSTFQKAAEFTARGGRTGPWFRAGHILSERRQHALLTFENGSPAVRIFGLDRQCQTWITATLGLRRGFLRAVTGRFHPESSIDGVCLLRDAAVSLVREDGGRTPPAFPFGAVRCERSRPEAALAVLRRDGGDLVVVGVRNGSRCRLVAVERREVRPFATIEVPP